MTTFTEVEEWIRGAADVYGDPSNAVCQVFLRWRDVLPATLGSDLLVYAVTGQPDLLMLVLSDQMPPLPLPVRNGPPEIIDGDQLITYGAHRITDGVWAIDPSLNVEGVIHAFVVLHGVPEPAPWDRPRFLVAR
jgi:hypothetical protein